MGNQQKTPPLKNCIPKLPYYTLGLCMYIILYIIRARLPYDKNIATSEHEECIQPTHKSPGTINDNWNGNEHSHTFESFTRIIYTHGICKNHGRYIGREGRDASLNHKKYGRYK